MPSARWLRTGRETCTPNHRADIVERPPSPQTVHNKAGVPPCSLNAQRPGKLAFGTPGVATVPHLGAELLQKAAGFKLLHVPFKGATQQIQDLVGGSTQIDFQSSLVVALPQIRAANIKV